MGVQNQCLTGCPSTANGEEERAQHRRGSADQGTSTLPGFGVLFHWVNLCNINAADWTARKDEGTVSNSDWGDFWA